MSVFLRRHRDDLASIELCSEYKHNTGGLIVWAVVHKDMLDYLEAAGIQNAIDNGLDEDSVTLKAEV